MVINPIESYFEQLQEPDKSSLLFIRKLILNHSEHFTEHWKWGGVFYYYKKKMLCYFWFDKKTKQPYLSFGEGKYIHHPQLKSEGRIRFKLYFIETNKDIDVDTITYFLNESIKSMIERDAVD